MEEDNKIDLIIGHKTYRQEEGVVEVVDDINNNKDDTETLQVSIVSARYTPCERQQQRSDNEHDNNNNNNNNNNNDTSIYHTRDVTSFIRALLIAQKKREGVYNNNGNDNEYCLKNDNDKKEFRRNQPEQEQKLDGNNSSSPSRSITKKALQQSSLTIGLNAFTKYGQRRVQIPLLSSDQQQTTTHEATSASLSAYKTMNGIFGDPIPGISKRLYIHYHVSYQNSTNNIESHSMSYAEHERVYLRIRNIDHNKKDNNNKKEQQQQHLQYPTTSKVRVPLKSNNGHSEIISDNVSEIVIPLIMPLLSIRERFQCRLVCKVWKNIIQEWGIATVIDDNDPSLQTKQHQITGTAATRQPIVMIRGILKHSYTSLHSLFLSGTPNIQKDDIHIAIPYLEKLHTLDISRCIQLDDTTLQLLSKYDTSKTLQVLYMKGLRNVTDNGIIAIATKCINIYVLDISNIMNITDHGATYIGLHLQKLRALYVRDNFHLTNNSINCITAKCIALEQLTLWGCTKLDQLFVSTNNSNHHQQQQNNITEDKIKKSVSLISNIVEDHYYQQQNLVLLNLWGCFRLNDQAAMALKGMNKLQSLVVSECHRLSDEFVALMVKYVPQLQHLHLRYCKKITDHGLNIITHSMPYLYSLDLSFCTRITITAICQLLQCRIELAELRLQGCRNLDIDDDDDNNNNNHGRRRRISAGRQLVNILRSNDDRKIHHNNQRNRGFLSVLDVRQCGGYSSNGTGYSDRCEFVSDMKTLKFEQCAPGFFSRPVRHNPEMELRLVKQFLQQG